MSYLLLLPEMVLVAFALALPGLDIMCKNKKVLPYFSIGGLLVSIVLLLGWMDIIPLLSVFGLSVPTEVFGGLAVDAFSVLFKLIFAVVTLMVVVASSVYIKDDPHQGEYYTLLLLATVGMMIVASATDLIILVIGLETASLSSYALAGFRKKERKSAEAAMKYFIIGAMSSAILLYGISIIYGVTGTTDISGISDALFGGIGFDGLLVAGVIFLMVGFGFKVAAAPFHMWAPDVYEGAPTTITTFLAAGSKKMGFVAFFKVFLVALIALKADWSIAFGILAVLTMTVGNVVAIKQKSVKRMLAYSSIAQAGYLLIVLAVGTQYALAGGIFHMMTHVFMKGGAFIVVAILSVMLIGDKLEDLKGLRVRAPVTAFCMAIFMLSLAGIPPFGGFASKFVLFSSAVDAGGWLIWLAVIAVLNSALSLYYYARVLKLMYVLDGPIGQKLKEPRPMLLVLIVAVIAIVLMGVLPGPFIDAAMEAARTLMP